MTANPILLVKNAGHGVTPDCPEAKFKPGDVVKVPRLKYLKHLPQFAAVAVVVPPGVPPEYALADSQDKPRPLQITQGKRCVSYLVGFEGDRTPHLIKESALMPSGQEPVSIKWVK